MRHRWLSFVPILICAFTLLCGGVAQSQVVFDAKNSTSAGGVCNSTNGGVCNANAATNLTFTHVMGSVSNGAIVIPVMFAATTLPGSLAVTYNSVALTKITGTDTGTNGGCSCAGAIFAGLAPSSGSHTVSITWTGALEAHAVSASFSGVDQTSVAVAFPHGTFLVQNASTASPATKAVTSATNNIVLAYATEQSSGFGTISGTLIYKDDVTGPNLTFAANYTAGAATVNPSIAFATPSTWSFGATDILAASGGGGATSTSSSTLMGVGP